MRRPVIAAFTILIASSIAPAALATITLGGGTSTVYSAADDGNGPEVYTEDLPTSSPDAGSVTSVDGTNSATINYDLSDLGFGVDFDLTRDAPYLSQARSSLLIYFSPSVNMGYSISGTFASDGSDSDVQLFVELLDLSLSQEDYVVFLSYQESQATAAESFVVGESGGDTYNDLIGSLTGTLIADHLYRFQGIAGVGAYPSAASGSANGTGFVTFALVPEPGTGLLLMAGLIVLCQRRRRS
jgi:PEP-CTERM motif